METSRKNRDSKGLAPYPHAVGKNPEKYSTEKVPLKRERGLNSMPGPLAQRTKRKSTKI